MPVLERQSVCFRSRNRGARIPITALILASLWAGQARAEPQPITSRDYTLDLYQGAVLGSVRIVGMGGAAVALAEGSASMLANPAAPAVRPATSNDTWDWDWHADWLSPALGSDYDNNGMPTEVQPLTAPLLTLGAVLQYRQWALGVGGLFAQRPIPRQSDTLTPSFEIGRVMAARSLYRRRLTLGVGVRTGRFLLSRSYRDAAAGGREVTTPLFEIVGSSLEAGMVWRPLDHDLRVGAAVSLPVSGRDTRVEACDPEDCEGYILPRAVEVPWEISAGVGWRLATSRWNRKHRGPWRDEGYLLLAADLVITGAVAGGAGMEAFLDKLLQPSGRSTSVSVRAGVEREWLPGRLRVRGGGYWEPGRFEDVSGRLHATAGLDWRLWSFRFWDDPYRLRLSLTVDGARDYLNSGLSLGFWH